MIYLVMYNIYCTLRCGKKMQNSVYNRGYLFLEVTSSMRNLILVLLLVLSIFAVFTGNSIESLTPFAVLVISALNFKKDIS